MLGLVGGQQHGHAACTQRGNLVQHADLVAEVQAGRGLVHDQQRGLLGQGACDQHQLALAAAQLGVGTQRQMGDAQLLQAAQRQGTVGT